MPDLLFIFHLEPVVAWLEHRKPGGRCREKIPQILASNGLIGCSFEAGLLFKIYIIQSAAKLRTRHRAACLIIEKSKKGLKHRFGIRMTTFCVECFQHLVVFVVDW